MFSILVLLTLVAFIYKYPRCVYSLLQLIQSQLHQTSTKPLETETIFTDQEQFIPITQSFQQKCSQFGQQFIIQHNQYQWPNINVSMIGYRTDKYVYLLNSNHSHRYLMQFNIINRCKLQLKQDFISKSVTNYLQKLRHPNLQAIIHFQTNHTHYFSITVSKLYTKSIKDLLYAVNDPLSQFHHKYQSNFKGHSIPIDKIQTYGQQILLALKYLHDQNYFHNNIHLGNIYLLHNNKVKLGELQNYLLNLKPRNYTEIKQVIKIKDIGLFKSSHQIIDILQFGQILYQMSTGLELKYFKFDINDIQFIDHRISNILQTIFGNVLPQLDVDGLLSLDFFSQPDPSLHLDLSFDYSNQLTTDNISTIDQRNLFILNNNNYTSATKIQHI